MRRALAHVLAAVCVAALSWNAPGAAAQQAAAEQGAANFASLYKRWQEAQDFEQKIEIGEQLLAAEPSLATWPLETAREQVKAAIRLDLGVAYFARVKGDRADDQEKAIAHLEAALSAWIREGAPEDRGRAHINLAVAYTNRIRGARADNQEKSLAHLEAAATVFSRAASPQEWALIQNNLAAIYLGRIKGDRKDNVEAAIKALESALEVYTREADPQRWATTQLNLSSAYGSLKRGERADSHEKQIAHLEAALTVFTREASPMEWGMTQQGLGVAYVDRKSGEPAGNREKAIEHNESALSVFTREAFPENWAVVQYNLGNVYKGAKNWQKAIAAYEAALSVFTRDAFPLDHLSTSKLLAHVSVEAKDPQKAKQAYASAREAFLLLFGQGLDDVEASELVREAGPLFADAAFAAVERGETEAALEWADEGRARLLAVALKLQTLDLPPDERRHLDDLRAAVRAAKQAVEAAHGTERAAAVDKLIGLRQELLALVKSGGRDEGKPQSALSRAREIVADGGAVAMPIVTGYGGKILVMVKAADGKGLSVIDMPELTHDRLAQVLIGPGDGPPGGWTAAYFVNYLDDAERNKRWAEWTGAIDNLGSELWGLLGARLDKALKERGLKSGARLVWLPSGWLGMLPLGLAQDPASKRRLADDYVISYAPSIEALSAAQRTVATAGRPTLAAIINPTGDLPGSEKEGAIVASHFAEGARTLLVRKAATPDAVLSALKGKSHWHFASHGTFSWTDVRQSALFMYGPARLSVGRLLETDGLGHPRLVVLSACETGLSEITANPDEFIGLPGTFTALGAAGVLGTLWPVNDAATALLMAKFYELHMGGGLSPAAALSKAQAWLREAKSDELNAYSKSAVAQGRLESRQLAEIEEELSTDSLSRSCNCGPVKSDSSNNQATGATGSIESKPRYAHPFFWGGFILTGL